MKPNESLNSAPLMSTASIGPKYLIAIIIGLVAAFVFLTAVPRLPEVRSVASAEGEWIYPSESEVADITERAANHPAVEQSRGRFLTSNNPTIVANLLAGIFREIVNGEIKKRNLRLPFGTNIEIKEDAPDLLFNTNKRKMKSVVVIDGPFAGRSGRIYYAQDSFAEQRTETQRRDDFARHAAEQRQIAQAEEKKRVMKDKADAEQRMIAQKQESETVAAFQATTEIQGAKMRFLGQHNSPDWPDIGELASKYVHKDKVLIALRDDATASIADKVAEAKTRFADEINEFKALCDYEDQHMGELAAGADRLFSNSETAAAQERRKTYAKERRKERQANVESIRSRYQDVLAWADRERVRVDLATKGLRPGEAISDKGGGASSTTLASPSGAQAGAMDRLVPVDPSPEVTVRRALPVGRHIPVETSEEPGKAAFFRAEALWNGSPNDLAEAVDTYRRASELGYPAAMHRLGVLYATGNGVSRSDKLTIEYYSRAAELGFAEAQYDLGVRYILGRGVQKSEETGIAWYRRAAVQGYQEAIDALGQRGIAP